MKEQCKIEAAIFDLDGTLLDSSRIWDYLGERFLRSQGVAPEPQLSAVLGLMSFDEGCSYICEQYPIRHTAGQVRAAMINILSDFYRSECRLKPGALRLLTEMRECGIPAATATAGDRSLAAAALERLGIADFFCGMVTCRECGGKDKPQIFLTAAALTESTPQRTIVFEDSFMAVRTAKAAGFLTAAVEDISEPQQRLLKRTADLWRSSPEGYLGLFRGQLREPSASDRISPSSSPV